MSEQRYKKLFYLFKVKFLTPLLLYQVATSPTDQTKTVYKDPREPRADTSPEDVNGDSCRNVEPVDFPRRIYASTTLGEPPIITLLFSKTHLQCMYDIEIYYI